MKKFLFFFLLLFPFTVQAQQNCSVEKQKPIQLLTAELKRGFKVLKKQNPPIYYLSYTLQDEISQGVWVTQGGIEKIWDQAHFALTVFPRVGNSQLDNTRTLKKGQTFYGLIKKDVPGVEGDGKAFTNAVWLLTQQAVEWAQEDYSAVQADAHISSERLDDSPDFMFPPKETFCREQNFSQFDLERITQLLLKASKRVNGKSFVLSSSFKFSNDYGYRYFVDSVGTRLKTPSQLVRLTYSIEGQTEDGTELSRGKSYDVLTEEELPSEEDFLAAVDRSILELEQQIKAPDADPITVPAILQNKAMGVFVHEVLGHRAEGHRQKEDSFGRTFTDKVGQPIVSSLLTIVDDPTLPYFNGEPLRGFYEYDSEGVKAAPALLVENGVLKNFLMSSSPIHRFAKSNGHGRAEPGRRPVSRMGNTRVIASKTVSYEDLEKQLLEQIKEQGKPYGIIIEDLSGGFTITETFAPQSFKLEPTFMYRLYPDGRKEVVRGADIVGTPLVSFKEVLAAADDYAVFNGSCGAESGWVPVSAIAPSVLLRALELEKTQKTAQKLPILPPPSSEVNP